MTSVSNDTETPTAYFPAPNISTITDYKNTDRKDDNMIIAYARVSTNDQLLDRQIDMLTQYGYDQLFQEKYTGTKANRPEFDKVRLLLREGDELVVESLSRVSRSTRDLLNILDELEKKGVKLVSLKENIDTSSPTGKLLVTVLSAICQFERDLTVQRTCEGLKASRARGRFGGRPKTDSKQIEQAVKLYRSKSCSVKEITQLTGVSSATLYRYLSQKR